MEIFAWDLLLHVKLSTGFSWERASLPGSVPHGRWLPKPSTWPLKTSLSILKPLLIIIIIIKKTQHICLTLVSFWFYLTLHDYTTATILGCVGINGQMAGKGRMVFWSTKTSTSNTKAAFVGIHLHPAFQKKTRAGDASWCSCAFTALRGSQTDTLCLWEELPPSPAAAVQYLQPHPASPFVAWQHKEVPGKPKYENN